MSWSVQMGGSSCFFSAVHLDADSLYVIIPKFQFVLPSSITELDNFTEVLKKLLTFRKSIYSIADAVEGSLTTKHSVQTALGRTDDETRMDPRL